jgi:hypothetical protein
MLHKDYDVGSSLAHSVVEQLGANAILLLLLLLFCTLCRQILSTVSPLRDGEHKSKVTHEESIRHFNHLKRSG